MRRDHIRRVASKLLVYSLLGVLSLSLSCKLGNKSGDDTENQNEDLLIVALKLKIEQDDKLELYYRGEKEQYNSQQKITAEVKGSENIQEVAFVFDLLEFPTHIRIDLGENRDQAEIRIQELAFRYNEAQHIFSLQEIEKYFKPNSGLKFNFEELSGKGVVVNGKYDPYLASYDISYFVNKLILF